MRIFTLIGLALVVGCAGPTQPSPVVSSPLASIATPAPVSPPATIPPPPTPPASDDVVMVVRPHARAGRTSADYLAGFVAELTTIALNNPQKNISFDIKEAALTGGYAGARITGVLWPVIGSGSSTIALHMLTVPKTLRFSSKAALLTALQNAVTYRAEVRLVNKLTFACCLSKPPISVTGRFEGDFTPQFGVRR